MRGAAEAVDTHTKVLALKNGLEINIIHSFGRKSHSLSVLLNQLFQNPIINIKKVKDICGLSFKAANDLVTDFVNRDILIEMTGQTRNRVFIFESYLNLFRE